MTLAGSDPPIRRRVRIPCSFTLADLHWVIQTVFDWDHAHLHAFEVRGKRYEAPSSFAPDWNEERALDASTITLWELKLGVKGWSFEYLYDFGDHWLHQIDVVGSGPPEPGASYPLCVAGSGRRHPRTAVGWAATGGCSISSPTPSTPSTRRRRSVSVTTSTWSASIRNEPTNACGRSSRGAREKAASAASAGAVRPGFYPGTSSKWSSPFGR